MRLTNNDKIGLSMAVFLATDEYDYDPRPNAISTTGLIKPIRQIVLGKRVESSDLQIDISTLVASRFGQAIHDGVEKSWTNKRYIPALRKLGYSDSMIQRVIVNPEPNELQPDSIPVYMEKRAERELDGIIVRGKFDFVAEGELEDHKTTGVFAYMTKTNNDKYRLQGSIYRWLNPDIITSDRMLINFTFTDWSKLRAKIEAAKGYPAKRMLSMPVRLMTIPEIHNWLEGRIRMIKANLTKAEPDLPLCTKEELWQDDTIYKYYSNPASKEKSTKNFDNFAEAQARLMKDGSKGCIDIVRGMAKACGYCNALPICSQAKQLLADGLLEI
jgi:hypothetical protein